MPQLEKFLGKVYLWAYLPNLPAAIIFAALFSLLATAHIWKMARTKMWFCTPFVIGGLSEPIGYACRAIARYYTASLIPFLLQGVFLLLPPVLFAATLYMVYSRLVRSVHGERFSPISMRWCTRFFVFGDFTCLNIQSTGAGLLGKPKNVKIGNAIISAGVGLHCVVFVGFMYCCVVFHSRFRAHLAASGERTNVPWEPILKMLYATSFIILARNIFRLAEYVMGKDGYLLVNEWPVYVFDGVLMLIVMAVFFVWYPDQLQRGRTESMIELTSDGGLSEEQDRAKKLSSSVMPGLGRS
ncbi:RTA1-domain-containing protein [Ophiobolus disseminans]|uniref:RTA1-domain-containing protein n=1 Tax=Ophiobolus disseminans TaxID=1469910 RepID=A0A6A6ZKC3_9PLEO|nr:RTA1-domain-containing protein [Ophiobolus disseminans]